MAEAGMSLRETGLVGATCLFGRCHVASPPERAAWEIDLIGRWHAVRLVGVVALPSLEYTPRDPKGSVLYQILRDHFETFRAEAARLRDGEGLPRFVEEEFEAYLRCGWLAGGFARFRCGCGLDRLVAFSCKGRGSCASCGGRRMTERAAHLVDHVFPDVPVRQWVLSLPPRIRYLLAWRHDLCKAVVGVLLREVHRQLRERARARGFVDPRGGAVAIVQRFGGALNLNVHIHALVLDGMFARAEDGRLAFHAVPVLTEADVADVLAAVAPGVTRARAAGIRRRRRRRRPGGPVRRGDAAAGRPGGRVGAGGGRAGSCAGGVPRAARRADVVRRPASVVPADQSATATPGPAPAPVAGGSGSRWADLMRRAFGVDVLACPRCGGRMRLVALIEASAVTERILRHLGLPTEVPEARPARAPPLGGCAA